MTEETKGKQQEEERKQDEGAEEEPQVYSVKKELTGWKFSRREFLAAAAAAATAGAVSAGDSPEQVAAKPVRFLEDRTEPAKTDLEPGQPFTKVLRFKNISDTAWDRGNRLHLVGGDGMQAPASVSVPNAAPGATVSIRLDLVAPADPGHYQINWHFPITDTLSYVSYLPLVVRNFVSTPAPEATSTPTATTTPSSTSTATPTATSTSTATPTSTPVPTQASTPTRSPTSPPTPSPTVEGCLVESPHPYRNRMSQTWVVINPDPNAQGTRAHFSQVSVEANRDYVIVKDSTGQEYQRITGHFPDGLWSAPVPGREFQVQLVSSASVTRWGFCLDQVQTTTRPPTPTPTSTPTSTRTPTPRPCSCVGRCSCASRTHYWYPN